MKRPQKSLKIYRMYVFWLFSFSIIEEKAEFNACVKKLFIKLIVGGNY